MSSEHDNNDAPFEYRGTRPLIFDAARPTPGFNVDRIDVAAGLRELKACGYDEPHTTMVIEHALMRWARGEEAAAERGAIDRSFHGIDFGSWRRVLAAARAAAEAAAARGCVGTCVQSMHVGTLCPLGTCNREKFK